MTAEHLDELEQGFIASALACGFYSQHDQRLVENLAGVLAWFEPEYLVGFHWRETWRALRRLFADGKPIMPLAIIQELTGKQSAEVLTHAEIADLVCDRRILWHHLPYLASEVHRAWRSRELAEDLRDTSEELEHQTIDPDHAIGHLGQLGGKYAPAMPQRATSNREVLRDIFEGVDDTADRLPTGVVEVDHLLRGGGLAPGQLMIVAGRTSNGKSSIAAAIAAHAIFQHGKQVVYTSLEMTNREVLERLIAWHCRGDAFRSPKWNAAANAMRQREDLVQITSDSEIGTIERTVQTYAQRGCSLAIVDYLQLARSSGTKHSTREQEVSDVSRRLKRLAMQCGIPVIALAQLNRQADEGPPRLSFLRESGSIEQDADLVLMIQEGGGEAPFRKADRRSVMTLHLAKHRGGPAGSVQVMWDKQANRYDQLANSW